MGKEKKGKKKQHREKERERERERAGAERARKRERERETLRECVQNKQTKTNEQMNKYTFCSARGQWYIACDCLRVRHFERLRTTIGHGVRKHLAP